ncbi:MAG: glucose-1-phosphate cytidylyltransferase [Cyanobacteria bacterium SIG27]|nr:glucose-1-phosphate cytidylyltransferase [Cyanobacteria bacterium SIG27]MBQ9150395.1 glucose-1-phosphate cytidylyltransferase [bacterium]
MKVLILAGGLGTRLGEETISKPKPMVEIGGYPILWHIMKIYSHYGFNDFVILTGYKSHMIKDYFVHYYQRYSDITVNLTDNSVEIHKNRTEPWKVTMLYTGQDTMTGGRIKKAQEYVGKEPFMLTYGDGVSDINILELIKTHKASNKLMTMTAVQPSGRFGALNINEHNLITSFKEKPQGDGAWINGGFFVCENEVFDFIEENNPMITFEKEPLENIANNGQLNAYKHSGFWRPMDTLRDKIDLENLWENKQAPWKVWDKQNAFISLAGKI